jgi:hypothetical protein
MKMAMRLSWQARQGVNAPAQRPAARLARCPVNRAMLRCSPGDGGHRCKSRRKWWSGNKPASNPIAMAMAFAAIVKVEDQAERNNRQGM